MPPARKLARLQSNNDDLRRYQLLTRRLTVAMARKKLIPDESDESNDPVAEPALEIALAELTQIVNTLESGQEPLDQSLQRFERGMALLPGGAAAGDFGLIHVELDQQLLGIHADAVALLHQADRSADGGLRRDVADHQIGRAHV